MRVKTGMRMMTTAKLAVAMLVATTALVSGGAAPTQAQAAGGIAGTVTDAATGSPIGGAHVAALRTSGYTFAKGAIAAANGAFTLNGLAAGDYYLFVLDPAGGHAADFYGAPTPVTVAASGMTAADPLLSGTRGRIDGAVTTDGSGDPVPGAWVAVLGAGTGRLEAGVVADASGAFAVEGLAPGGHLLIAVDPTGRHAPEFYDNSPGPDGATPVIVSPGGPTTVALSLVPAPTVAPDAAITGRVTEAGSGAALPGSWVVALQAATRQFVAGTRADGNGNFSLGVAPGTYLVEIVDPTNRHAAEWYDGRPFTGLADASPVSTAAGSPATVDADLDPTTGALGGTVTEDFSGDPIAGAWVVAIGPGGALATTAGPDGTYAFADLRSGTYRAAFLDPEGAHPLEYWNASPDYAGAAAFNVAAGATTAISTSLTPTTCTGAGAPVECMPAYPLPAPGAGWSKYTIATGAHSATVTRGAQATNPLAGFSSVPGRRYHFLFDSSARYVLTNPTQPDDQFDWNKLPGLSDCGSIDLSQNGWMFGWRWRTDTSPRRLEVTAYANNNGTHLTPATPMVTLSEQQVEAGVPLWFDLSISPDHQTYQFRVNGPGTRTTTASLPRQCPTTSTTVLKWASGFYFGGTSTAPNTITGWVNEP